MSFLAGLLPSMSGLASTIFSSPLVSGLLSNVANGVVSTLKESAVKAVNQFGEQANNYGNNLTRRIQEYQPPPLYRPRMPTIDEEYEAPAPRYNPRPRKSANPRRPNKRKRPVYQDDENDWQDYQPQPQRRPYNPDLIVDYEEE